MNTKSRPVTETLPGAGPATERSDAFLACPAGPIQRVWPDGTPTKSESDPPIFVQEAYFKNWAVSNRLR
jgi:hypothetical protein